MWASVSQNLILKDEHEILWRLTILSIDSWKTKLTAAFGTFFPQVRWLPGVPILLAISKFIKYFTGIRIQIYNPGKAFDHFFLNWHKFRLDPWPKVLKWKFKASLKPLQHSPPEKKSVFPMAMWNHNFWWPVTKVTSYRSIGWVCAPASKNIQFLCPW